MSEPFIAEIRIFGFNFAPRNWAFCNGQILPIAQNTALFSLVGTMYGGNGQTTFALPNLQARAPMGTGQGPGLSNRSTGENGGQEAVTLIASEMPAHGHAIQCNSGNANSQSAAGTFLATEIGPATMYSSGGGAGMAADALGASGGGQPHPNMQPFLTLNFCIALLGIFPSRN
jgi:microcystin-dependent protein